MGKGNRSNEGNLYLISPGLSVNTCHGGGGSVIQQYVFLYDFQATLPELL